MLTNQPLRMLPMEPCHNSSLVAAFSLAQAHAHELLAQCVDGAQSFAELESQVHDLVCQLERAVLKEGLQAHDLDVAAVIVDDEVHRRVGRWPGTYLTRAGEICVERTLYRASGSETAVPALDLRVGVVEGYWTPGAASLATWAVAHLTAQEATELFGRCGGMEPSRSSLDRLPKALSEGWEAQRPRFEENLRVGEVVPSTAVSVMVSADGVMLPMKDGNRQQKRAAARRKGKETRGPAGYREASSGVLAFYDAEGQRVGQTIFLGRMPEKGKKSLKEMLEDELLAVLEVRPDLRVVAVADGARDNWTWLERAMPAGTVFVLDFFHAAEHLKRALDSAHGENTPKARAEFARLRTLLRDAPDGVGKVINALAYQRRKHPRRKAIERELRYFRRNRPKMAYAKVTEQNMPIGSGVVEAANKTLVTVRMKRAGARWSIPGGQAVLTFRALAKSDRYDRAFALISGTYTQQVSLTQARDERGQRRAA